MSSRSLAEEVAPSRNQVQVVLFDFGGVVIRTPFELASHEHGRDWMGPFDPDNNDELWELSQSGEITERDYWHRRAAELHPDSEDPTFTFMRTLYERPEDVVVRPEIVALIDELGHRELRVAALTNDLAKFHPQEWRDRMTVIQRFDPLIDLSHAGVLTPQPAPFERAIAELGVPASAVVFLDDQLPNVEGATAAGMTAVWFDPTQVEESLERLRAALV
jgi:putative hydrolase of the HAD superfamily